MFDSTILQQKRNKINILRTKFLKRNSVKQRKCYQMSINERIREVMFFSKKSGTELANELGITKSTITRTIKGDTLPSSKMLIPLGEKLGISIDWLLFGDGQMLRANNSSHVIDGNVRGEEIVVNNQGDKIDFLEKQIKLQNEQIKLLKQTIGDKEEIIKMLKAQ